ncbi:hypothetical protein ABTZ99_38020 [Actinosynnema sp. NPDC002837]
MTDLDWVPEGIDTTVPSVARTYEDDTRVWAGVGRKPEPDREPVAGGR